MKRGVVVGEVWATRKVSGLSGYALKLVVESAQPAPVSTHTKPPHAGSAGLARSSESDRSPALSYAPLVVAIDTLDARNGQDVLVAYGSGARNVLEPGPHNRHLVCDAAVALLIDSDEDDPSDSPAGDT